jgi:hypothetical protein
MNIFAAGAKNRSDSGLTTTFPSIQEAEMRLKDAAQLNEVDIKKLVPWLGFLSAGGVRRLEAELAVGNIQAVRQLDESSRRVGMWGLLLNIALFALTIVALVVAVKSYRDTKAAAVQQQKTLDSSNKALEDSVLNLTAMNRVIEAQWQKQVEAERKKPITLVGLQVSSASPTREINLSEKASETAAETSPAKLFFMLQNNGDAPLVRPTYIVRAFPNTVVLECDQGLRSNSLTLAPNMCQYNSPTDVMPILQDKVRTRFEVNMKNPDGNAFVDLDLDVLSTNAPMQEYKAIIRFAKGPH